MTKADAIFRLLDSVKKREGNIEQSGLEIARQLSMMDSHERSKITAAILLMCATAQRDIEETRVAVAATIETLEAITNRVTM